MDKFEETFSEINSDDIVDVKDISEDPFDDEYQVPVLTAVFNTVRVKIRILQAEFCYYSVIFVLIRIQNTKP